jgi:hypothetical protein
MSRVRLGVMVHNYLAALTVALTCCAFVNLGAALWCQPADRLHHLVAVGACGIGVATCAALGVA